MYPRPALANVFYELNPSPPVSLASEIPVADNCLYIVITPELFECVLEGIAGSGPDYIDFIGLSAFGS
jgi:hypothetical protein